MILDYSYTDYPKTTLKQTSYCTSIALPFIAVTTSPGLFAVPEGIFSHNGVTAITFSGNSSLAIVSRAPVMVAAPPISPFINDIPAEGLIDIPPLTTKKKETLLGDVKLTRNTNMLSRSRPTNLCKQCFQNVKILKRLGIAS